MIVGSRRVRVIFLSAFNLKSPRLAADGFDPGQPTRGNGKSWAGNRKQPSLAICSGSSRQTAEVHARQPGRAHDRRQRSPQQTLGGRFRQQKPAADKRGPRQTAAAHARRKKPTANSRGARRTAEVSDRQQRGHVFLTVSIQPLFVRAGQAKIHLAVRKRQSVKERSQAPCPSR